MRCALAFDEDKPLYEQSLSAWGEMQSLKEEPAYKEADISDPAEKALFKGAKFYADQVCNILDNMESDGDLAKNTNEDIQDMMAGELCMMLFSILDNQEE